MSKLLCRLPLSLHKYVQITKEKNKQTEFCTLFYDVCFWNKFTNCFFNSKTMWKKASNMDYPPWTWTSLNFMIQSHANLNYLDFLRDLQKDAIIITTLLLLLIIIIIITKTRHEQVVPKLLKCETGLVVCNSFLLRKKSPSPVAKASSLQRDGLLTMLAVPSLLLHQGWCAPARALSSWMK